jgi:hypothetical protein
MNDSEIQLVNLSELGIGRVDFVRELCLYRSAYPTEEGLILAEYKHYSAGLYPN